MKEPSRRPRMCPSIPLHTRQPSPHLYNNMLIFHPCSWRRSQWRVLPRSGQPCGLSWPASCVSYRGHRQSHPPCSGHSCWWRAPMDSYLCALHQPPNATALPSTHCSICVTLSDLHATGATHWGRLCLRLCALPSRRPPPSCARAAASSASPHILRPICRSLAPPPWGRHRDFV